MMREAKHVAWLAGLLEGEGCFRLHKDKRGNHRTGLLVTIQMTDRDVIERAAGVFPCGTGVREARRSGIDNQGRDRSTWGFTYVKDWNGADAERVMRAVLPYMGERRSAKIRECLTTPNLSHQKKATA